MSLGSWEITIPQTFKKDGSTSEVLNDYIEVSCSLWPSQADVAWYYWSLGLLSFAVNLFCKTRLLLLPHWVKMLCVSEFSSPFLQALVLAEVPFTPDVFSLIFSHSDYLCVCQTWEAQGCAAGSSEYQRNANGCNSWITMCTCTWLFRNSSTN